MSDVLDSEVGQFDSKQAAQDNATSPVAVWMEAIDLAGKVEKDWRKDVETATDVFRGKEGEQGTAFNIYHSNVQTLVPAVYNSTPIPDIRPRFPDPDPIANQGAEVIERSLNHTIDEYDFDSVMESSVFDMSNAGRGVAKIAYKPVLGPVGMDEMGQPIEDVVYQSVSCAHVPWAAFRHGPGRSWTDVPWVAFANYFTKEALQELSPEHGAKVPLDMQLQDGKDGAEGDRPAKDTFKRALVWEVWDKESRKVKFIAPGYRDAFLADADDPLELESFFPVPAPMMGTRIPGELTPICEYTIYKRLLNELDKITTRITTLIAQLRVRFMYAGKSDAIDAWAKAGDGEGVEAPDAVGFLQSGGMEKALAWWPLDPTVKALESLYSQREQVKQSIYEVTGMSDIVRGDSDPNETATAQEIKNKWGAIRIRQRQKEAQRFARDILRLKAEIICKKFTKTPQLLQQICGFEIDPQVLQMLADDNLRSYRVDIETDSTIQGDLQFNQEEMSGFLEATGTFFGNMTAPVQLGMVQPATVMTVYGAFARNFNLSKTVEDALDQAVQFAAQQPSPQQQQQQAQQAEQQAQQQQADQAAQQQQAEAGAKQQEAQAKAQAEGQKMQMQAQAEQQKMAIELQRHEQAMAFEREKLQMSQAFEQQKFDRDMQMRDQELGFQRSVKRMDAFNQEAEAGPFDQMMSAVNQLAQFMRQSMQMQAQSDQAIQQGIAELHAIAAAPAEIIRDDQGRPVGAQKRLNRRMN